MRGERSARVGEQAWGDLMARHNELVRRSIDRHRGIEGARLLYAVGDLA